MRRLLPITCAAVMLSATLPAAQYDRLLDAIDVPDGAYFDTGYVVKDHPRVVASISVGELNYDFDLFGVKHRSEGCWILNVDGTTTGGYQPSFYYRYGTASSGGAVGGYSARQRLDIDCGKTLFVNGEELQTFSDYDFSENATTMTIPGTEDAHRFTLMAFQLWDGGVLVRDFLPAEKNGVCGLYDRANDQFYAPVSGTVAPAYDQRVEAIHIPAGAYFDTGYVVTDHPRVVASISVGETNGQDFDLFGVKERSDGCWILNVDGSTTGGYYPSFYYRYGTYASGGAVGSFSSYQRLLIDCGRTLVVNGNEIQTAADYDFAANTTAMTIPGERRAAPYLLHSFKIEDGGRFVRDFVPAVKNGACGLYDRIAGQFYANVGTGTVTAEQYDRLLDAIYIPDGAYFDTGYVVKDNPRVVASISVGELDYDFDLFGVKPRGEGCWILNVDGTTTDGYHPSFYYRYGTAWNNGGVGEYTVGQRLDIDCGKTLVVNGVSLQTVNDWDFSSNETTMTIPGTESGHCNRCTIMAFSIIDGGEYVRVFLPAEKNGVCGLYDRINHQFYAPVSGTASPVATSAPAGLTVRRGDFPNPVAVLSWHPALGSSGTSVLRAPGANGPWTEVAQVGEGADAYVDESAPVGVLCYYRVAANYSIGGNGVSFTNDTSVAFRRWRLLERDPGAMGHLRSGVNVIYNCGQEGRSPVYGQTWEAVTNSILLAFNNVLYRDSGNMSSAGCAYSYDWVGVADAAPSTCIGVDLGEAAHVAHARFYSVTSYSEGPGRVTGVTLYGSNDENWIQDGNHTALTDPLVWKGLCVWHDNDSLDTTNTYRYLYYTNPGVGWGGNVSEIQLYGWLDSDIVEAAQSVTDVAASYGSGATPSVTLTWTPVGHGTYTVERKTDDGTWQVVGGNLPAETASWTDSSVAAGTRYTYRVKTAYGAEVAYSEDCAARPYIAGSGVGLHGVWSSPYGTTGAGESVVSVETNATINFSNVSVGGSTGGFFVRWSGKLIVPFAGDYVFEAESDDAVNLWIDKAPTLYRKAKASTAQTSSSTALTAGEHDVVMTWFQTAGENVCRLYWSGAVERAIIPASQLVPVPNALPEGWAGARTFCANSAVCPSGDVLFGNDGSISFAYGGSDVANGEQGYNFLWQPFSGNFELTAKIESGDWAYDRFLGRKCGLMVRSGLAAGDPFAACFLRWRDDGSALMLGDKYRAASGEGISAIDDEFETTAVGVGNVGWLRLRREGNVFTFSYRGKDGNGATTAWKDYCSITDSEGAYGRTVYVGLTSSGSLAPLADVPFYNWEFSKVSISAPYGMRIIIR